jgi:3-oxoacyl-[acyl-carrier-protein] synthase-1
MVRKTGFILSTTKQGNISLIENHSNGASPEERISLNTSASLYCKTGFSNRTPFVISHACISGLLAMIRYGASIQSGVYDQLVIAGGDLITNFIYSLSLVSGHRPNPVALFDAARDGISLGEAAATIVLFSK